MRSSSILAVAALALTALLSGCAGREATPKAADLSCHIGVYRLSDGTLVDVAPTDDARLRWRRLDGAFGRLTRQADDGWASTLGLTDRADGIRVAFGACGDGVIRFAGTEGQRVPLVVKDTSFTSGGETLFGRLVLPRGDGPVPIIVAVHGSEKTAASVFNYRQRLYPAAGVGMFVYDKRGTGYSTGRYTQDFHLLAADAAAALNEARRLAGKRLGRIGFEGGSQGGWVAPLAATKVPADFVIVGYGLAEGALAEDREETLNALREKGHGDDVLQKAREVTDATGDVVRSDFKRGFPELNALKRKYGKEAWFKDLDGEYTGQFTRTPAFLLKIIGPLYDVGTSWDYDPMPTLAGLATPQLWVLAAEDREAPEPETARRLVALAAKGRPITVLEYPLTDHGIYEFETAADGARTPLRVADGFTRAVLEFAAAGRLDGQYGAGRRLTPAPASTVPPPAAGPRRPPA